MASKADFTEEEWETMRKGVAGAGMLVSVGDRDFTDTFGEAGALAKRLGQEREAGGSEFIRELAAGRPAGFGLTASAQEVEAETLQALRSATAILAAQPGWVVAKKPGNGAAESSAIRFTHFGGSK